MRMETPLSHYEVLGISATASEAQVHEAWRRVALEAHPDKLKQRCLLAGDEEVARAAAVNEAHDVLSDPHRRSVYDSSRKPEAPTSAARATLSSLGLTWPLHLTSESISPQIRWMKANGYFKGP